MELFSLLEKNIVLLLNMYGVNGYVSLYICIGVVFFAVNHITHVFSFTTNKYIYVGVVWPVLTPRSQELSFLLVINKYM